MKNIFAKAIDKGRREWYNGAVNEVRPLGFHPAVCERARLIISFLVPQKSVQWAYGGRLLLYDFYFSEVQSYRYQSKRHAYQ